MSYIYELAKTAEGSFTDCGVFAYNAHCVMEGAIRNVSLAVQKKNDRAWKRLQYYKSVDANIRAVHARHDEMWQYVKTSSGSDFGSGCDGDDGRKRLSPTTTDPFQSHRASNPLDADEAEDADYDMYKHVFTVQELDDFATLHTRAAAYTNSCRRLKAAQDAKNNASSKKSKDKAVPTEKEIADREAMLNAVHTSLKEAFDDALPRMFEAFRKRFLEAVNELRVCFRLSPQLAKMLQSRPQPDTATPPPSADTETPERTAAVDIDSGDGDAASEVLHGTEEVAHTDTDTAARGEVWFRFFYFDRLKSSTEKLSLTLTLCLLHFTRLEKKYDYQYPPALKAKLHNMLDVLNGYSWEKHRQRFESILRDMFHYRKNLEHLRWATEELKEIDAKIEKHSGDLIKRKLNKYIERRPAVQKDVDTLTKTLFESGADEMLSFYDALLTVVIKSLNDLVHLLNGSSRRFS